MPASGAGRAEVLRAMALALAVAIAAAGCAPSRQEEQNADLAASTVVSFRSPDGVKLAGRVFGDGQVGVVLAHMFPADQTSWWAFARHLAPKGFTVLTFDFRGYCPGGVAGCSEGQRDVAAMWQDVLGAVDFMMARGLARVMLVGASMGGTASLIAAAQTDVPVLAIVALSAPQSFEGLTADRIVLGNVTAAKLFVAGNSDPTGAATAAEAMYEESPPPKQVEIVTSVDHGTDLLTGNQSGRVQTLITGYLERYSGA
ncbi:MAG TPA: alpha/beta fold hydrolase [Actinomycetota bacterium]|nr:alpha/beta fold hydrolase [Actinomycetota bacterium]